ncbi:MAG: aldo/keto reductase [SAR324 cluster bacterium]|nr:aldo/keto reductase [SAR324 cluster bacterium]
MNELSILSTVKLNNQVEMPLLGLGIYETGSSRQTQNAVAWALEVGYRHIDTAKLYGNESDIAPVLQKMSLARNEVFVTSKLWNSDHGYDKSIRAFNHSLERSGLGYFDLFLIHWPVEKLRADSWRALETIYQEGKCRAIGVSNYTIRHLEELLGACKVPPAVNQVEYHPFLYQKKLLEFCRANNIRLSAYSPLTKGEKLDDNTLKTIGNRYGKSPAQIMIRWVLEQEVIVLPKSARQSRIIENAEVYDFHLEESDRKTLDALNQDWHCTWNPTNIV